MRILLVDDNSTNLAFLKKLVEKLGYQVLEYSSPEAVLADMPDLDYDVAVIDYLMPAYTGVELLAEICRFPKYRDKPTVFVTADTEMSVRMLALDAGAIDFLTKPVDPFEFQARMRNLGALVEARNQLAEKAEWLRREVDKALKELRAREEEIIERLTIAASYKDSDTAKHTRRVGAFSEAIASAYGLDPDYCRDIRLASPMHDIGKVGIPDSILLKRGKLTEREYAEMQHHTLVGRSILQESNCSLLQLAAEIAATHHERWDGQGYPNRLSGMEIPLAGRIVAIADNFDALTTARPYKEAWSVERTVDHIRKRGGSQFDPACVSAFVKALPTIMRIMLENIDEPRWSAAPNVTVQHAGKERAVA